MPPAISSPAPSRRNLFWPIGRWSGQTLRWRFVGGPSASSAYSGSWRIQILDKRRSESAQALKRHSREKTPVAKIAKAMKRTEAIIRMKAYQLGFSVGHRSRVCGSVRVEDSLILTDGSLRRGCLVAGRVLGIPANWEHSKFQDT